jgi:diacylglycerol kinase
MTIMSEISEIENRLHARDMGSKAQLLTTRLLNVVIWLMFALAVASMLEPVRQFEHGFLTVLDHMMGIR